MRAGMLFYDHTGALTQFQGFNNSTHEYRINNIARASPGGAFNGSINVMIGGSPKFVVATNGNVGIGTVAPSQKLHVAGDVAVDGNIISGNERILAMPGSDNLFVGAGSGAALTSGSGNAFVGPRAGAANTSGLANTFVGSDAGVQNSTGQQNSFLVSRRARRIRPLRGTPFRIERRPIDHRRRELVFRRKRGQRDHDWDRERLPVGAGAGNGNTTGSENVFVGDANFRLSTCSSSIRYKEQVETYGVPRMSSSV